MAFTKVTLTGVIDTVKASFTKVNDLIDDLLSTGNGLGASQVGIEDTAGNMDAANVEDALAEIYTDTASARGFADDLDENPATTTGLTWGYKSGVIRVDNTITSISAGTVGLTDNDTNYIEVDDSGTVSKNLSGFSLGKTPLREIVTSGGIQTSSTDSRSFLVQTGVWKAITLAIQDGSIGISLAVTVVNVYNGVTIAEEDNLEKGGTTASFELSAGGNVLRILPAALTANCEYAIMAIPNYNESTVAISVTPGNASNKLQLGFFNATTGASLDLTTLVDTGGMIITVLYTTSPL